MSKEIDLLYKYIFSKSKNDKIDLSFGIAAFYTSPIINYVVVNTTLYYDLQYMIDFRCISIGR